MAGRQRAPASNGVSRPSEKSVGFAKENVKKRWMPGLKFLTQLTGQAKDEP